MMFDTDVLIWYFRGNEHARRSFHDADEVTVSSITVMELFQGAKSKNELSAINRFLRLNSIRTFLLNEAVTLSAMDFVQTYTLSHGVQLADAMIAASAIYHGETLLTANVKHFQFIPQLTVKKFVP